jgi:hypothetical protein
MILDLGPDKRFYGIYRGIVVEATDPKGLGRAKVLVPQILGDAITNWAGPIVGGLVSSKTPYGLFTFNGTQSVTDHTLAYVVAHDTTEDNNAGVYLDPNDSGQKIRVSHTGDYQVIFSAEFECSVGATRYVDVWVRVNGVDLPRSSSRVQLSGSGSYVLACVPFILDLEANDYIEIVWSATGTNVALKTLTGLTAPTRPDVPAIITTVALIGNYVPTPGSPVWVMFEGGDPNFPLWLGAF